MRTRCNIMTEGLRTFRLAYELVRCNMSAGVHAHAGRMCHSEISPMHEGEFRYILKKMF